MTTRDDSDGGKPGERELRLPDYPRWTAEGGDVGLDLNQMHAELQRSIDRERGPASWLRSRTTPVRALLGGIAIAAIVVTTMTLWPRPDFSVYPYPRMVFVLVAMAALIAVDLVLVVWPLQLPAAPTWLTRAIALGAPVVLLALYALPAAHDHPRSVAPAELGALLAGTGRCLAVGTIVAAGLFALLRALDRGGTERQLLMAAGAGLGANLLLQLHCAVTTPAHLMVGHLGVLGLCFALAALLRRTHA